MFDQVGSVQPFANGEGRIADLGEPIPGAAELAVIASVDAISNERA
jgi:hypothetical protein